MKMVKGQLDNDCGVCVVATITGLTWQEAAARIWPAHHAYIDAIGLQGKTSYRTTTKEIMAALASLSYHLTTACGHRLLPVARRGQYQGWKYFESISHPDVVAIIVKVLPRGPGKMGHWVIYHTGNVVVYDPQSGSAWPPSHCPYQPSSYFVVSRTP